MHQYKLRIILRSYNISLIIFNMLMVAKEKAHCMYNTIFFEII